MRKSKYVGMKFGRWTCTAIYLAANYKHCTRHNAYNYQLERLTSDGICKKVIMVPGRVMTQIRKGIICPEMISEKKIKSGTKPLYRFVK